CVVVVAWLPPFACALPCEALLPARWLAFGLGDALAPAEALPLVPTETPGVPTPTPTLAPTPTFWAWALAISTLPASNADSATLETMDFLMATSKKFPRQR